MSITFYPNKEWKMVENPCDICGDNCDAGSDGNPYCTGTRPEPDCPTINMANGNAYAMLALLGLPTDECCGEVSANDLPRVMRAIIRARNVSARRTSATADPYESGGPGTGQCRMVYGGRNEEYVARRLDDLMGFVQHCQNEGCGFYWA